MQKIPQIEVYVKIRNSKAPSTIVDNTPAAVRVLRRVFCRKTVLWVEEVIILCLNAANTLIGCHRVALGGRDYAVADVRVIATVALNSAATKVILAHNHPSGQLQPSIPDLKYTEKVKAGLQTLNIDLADHLIITHSGHMSMAEEGYL